MEDEARRAIAALANESIDNADDAFSRVWDPLSEQGVCDSPRGTQYRRVLREWLAARLTIEHAPDFIRWRANLGPEKRPDSLDEVMYGPQG